MGRLHAQKEHGWMDDTTLISKKKKVRSWLVAKNTMRLNAYIAQTPTATVQANVSATARESRQRAALASAIACDRPTEKKYPGMRHTQPPDPASAPTPARGQIIFEEPMKEFPRRVLPGRTETISSVAIWDGPESLGAVLRLQGSGRLSLVHPRDESGKPREDSARNCLRIHQPDKTCVAHPGDLVVTDLDGRLGVIHGYEWSASHGARFTREDV